jgi:hypothetical protein
LADDIDSPGNGCCRICETNSAGWRIIGWSWAHVSWLVPSNVFDLATRSSVEKATPLIARDMISLFTRLLKIARIVSVQRYVSPSRAKEIS